MSHGGHSGAHGQGALEFVRVAGSELAKLPPHGPPPYGGLWAHGLSVHQLQALVIEERVNWEAASLGCSRGLRAHRMPEPLRQQLAALSPEQLHEVARRWSRCEGARERRQRPLRQLLEALRAFCLGAEPEVYVLVLEE